MGHLNVDVTQRCSLLYLCGTAFVKACVAQRNRAHVSDWKTSTQMRVVSSHILPGLLSGVRRLCCVRAQHATCIACASIRDRFFDMVACSMDYVSPVAFLYATWCAEVYQSISTICWGERLEKLQFSTNVT